MADNGPSGQAANLHLDEPTGEMVSKSELKKRQKQRQLEEKRAGKREKAAVGPTLQSAQKVLSAEEQEVELTPDQHYAITCRRIQGLRKTKSPNPYPHKFLENTDLRDFVAQYSDLKTGEQRPEVEIRIGGRIYTKRAAGPKLIFYDLKAWQTKIQIMCQTQEASGPVSFEQQHLHIRRGDIVGIIGYPGRTAPRNRDVGELSIFAKEIILLAPCLHQIPSDHYGFKNKDQRYRQRYLDLIMNDDVVDIFIKRDMILGYLREYFRERKFIEVDTPMLNAMAGGATAKPFITHHNELDMELTLRVAPELPLKKLLVGNIPRVFEIGKNFRNEGIDLTHNPEFTSCEFYWAFADYHDVLDLTEDMVSGLVKRIFGTYETVFHTKDGEEYHVKWAKPWKRVEMMPALEDACGEKFPPANELHTDETNKFLKRILEKTKVECSAPQTNARMLDKLVGEFIEETCINPTFITGHPEMMSPLAKWHRDKPGLCERFEAFVCKSEIVNAYTELNDPFTQRERFEEQARQKAQGDGEAQMLDEDFVRALEYGLTPCGGWGMGIDRLVMYLTDHYSIKEVIAFPFMKDEEGRDKKSTEEVVEVREGGEVTIPQR